MDESCLGDERNEKDRKKRLSHTLKYIPKAKAKVKTIRRSTIVSSIQERKQMRKGGAVRWCMGLEKDGKAKTDLRRGREEVHRENAEKSQKKKCQEGRMLLFVSLMGGGRGGEGGEGGGWC